jgi:tetratricopeptide (TPR) repeat protein
VNATDYTYLLNKPHAVQDKHTDALEQIVQEFPYFQSARALYLKGLYNQSSFKYNQQLKNTAACTTDRAVLFEFITSNTFTAVQRQLFDQKAAELLAIDVKDSEEVIPTLSIKENTLESSILTSIATAEPKVISLHAENESKPESNAIGAPLEFSTSEKHSFQEWLQLAKFQPIVRENSHTTTTKLDAKLEIIDKFIELNPKIPPVNPDQVITISTPEKPEDPSFLMTETLAKVYLEQKKYQKAIQAYEILILKYPEKSSFFADRILQIKELQ